MNPLDRAATAQFLDRFRGFHDTLLGKVEITYTSNGWRRVEVEIDAPDGLSSVADDWVRVRVTLEGVTDYCFADTAQTTCAVLSHGIHILWIEERVGVDFGDSVSAPEKLSELQTSKFFAIGDSASWEMVAKSL